MAESILDVAKRADLFFMEKSPIHDATARLANTFSEMEIPFAVAGAMAANAHGHKRTTADVDILIRLEDLRRFKEKHLGLGWVDKFAGSKNFRDTVNDVIQLIRANDLALDYANTLNAYVRDKYHELWQAAQVDDDY